MKHNLLHSYGIISIFMLFALSSNLSCSNDVEFTEGPVIEKDSSFFLTKDTTSSIKKILCQDTFINDLTRLYIINPNFEDTVTFHNTWKKSSNSYYSYRYLRNEGYKESSCIYMSTDANLINYISQKISLPCAGFYKLSVFVKTQDVDSNGGAYIGIKNNALSGQIISTSPKITGTNSWQRISTVFTTSYVPAKTQILCLLKNKGAAWFDHISLSVPDGYSLYSCNHFNLYIESKTIPPMMTNVFIRWLNHLDKAYDSYRELFDFVKPFYGYGEKMMIKTEGGFPHRAHAGYPIAWNTSYVNAALLQIKRYDDWCFTILHEIGHNFSPDANGYNSSWIWDEEFFANFRMYYIIDHLNARIYKNNKLYIGKEIREYYKSSPEKAYDRTWALNIPNTGDGLQYIFIKIVEGEGWEPFKKTFKQLYKSNLNLSGESSSYKIKYFLSIVSEYAGVNVLEKYFTPEQITALDNM